LLAAGELDELSLDQDEPVEEVDVAAAKADELAKAQAAVGGEEHLGTRLNTATYVLLASAPVPIWPN